MGDKNLYVTVAGRYSCSTTRREITEAQIVARGVLSEANKNFIFLIGPLICLNVMKIDTVCDSHVGGKTISILRPRGPRRGDLVRHTSSGIGKIVGIFKGSPHNATWKLHEVIRHANQALNAILMLNSSVTLYWA